MTPHILLLLVLVLQIPIPLNPNLSHSPLVVEGLALQSSHRLQVTRELLIPSGDATVPTASRGAKAKKKLAPQTLSEAIAYDLESDSKVMLTKFDDNADETSTNIRFAPSFTGPCDKDGENMNFM